MIVYLHGFRSGPRSTKARMLHSFMIGRGLGDHFVCPALPFDPEEAVRLAGTVIERSRASGAVVTLVGSSLGGYYATWLAERHDLRAVLVNPAVVAHLSLAGFVGPQTNLHSGEQFDFNERHIAALRALEVAAPSPERYLLLAEKGDELLDWRQAAERYSACRQKIFAGGDHGFSRFAEVLPEILCFAGLTQAPAT